jgi:hypothetical protein
MKTALWWHSGPFGFELGRMAAVAGVVFFGLRAGLALGASRCRPIKKWAAEAAPAAVEVRRLWTLWRIISPEVSNQNRVNRHLDRVFDSWGARCGVARTYLWP